MTLPIFLRCALLPVGLLVTGCGDDTTAATTTSAGGGATTGTASSSGATGGAGGAGGGATSYVPPPVPTACAVPVVSPGASWSAPTGESFGSPRIDWSGAEAAIAYAESDPSGAWTVKLQRLDGAGAALGSRVVLGGAASGAAPRVSLASDPSAFIACWDRAGNAGDEVACSRVAVFGSTSTPAYVGPGNAAAITIGPAGFGLFVSRAGELLAQRLDGDGLASGPEGLLATTTATEPAWLVPASTTEGYAVLELAWGGILWRLDRSFVEREGETVLGWSELPTGLAGSGPMLGTSYPSFGAGELQLRAIDDENVETSPVRVDDATLDVQQYSAMARGDGSFAIVWSAATSLGYRAATAAGVPTGDPLDIGTLTGTDDPVTVVGVSDGFLVGYVDAFVQDEIVILHLACP